MQQFCDFVFIITIISIQVFHFFLKIELFINIKIIFLQLQT